MRTFVGVQLRPSRYWIARRPMAWSELEVRSGEVRISAPRLLRRFFPVVVFHSTDWTYRRGPLSVTFYGPDRRRARFRPYDAIETIDDIVGALAESGFAEERYGHIL